MPSTPSAYPQVAARRFACFRVLDLSIYAGQVDLCAGFDSRQLHWKDAGQSHKLWPVFFFINPAGASAGSPIR
jgi:hypothetical protein